MRAEQRHRLLQAALAALRNARWLPVLGGIVLLALVFSQLSPAFLKFRNLQNIAAQASVTGIMAAGMTFVIMTAGIDISVGATIYLSLVLANEIALKSMTPFVVYLVYPLSVVLGAFLGLVNGLLRDLLRINPLVTTLATYIIYRGMATHITRAKDIHPPGSARFFGIGDLGGVPMPIVIVLVVALVSALVLRYTRFGRYVLAIGASPASAYQSGLPVRRVLVAVYVIAGACAGLGGLVLLGRVGAVQNDMGIGIEFTVITAVVLGGTQLSGGRGSVVGSLLGAVLLIMINNGLNIVRASPYIYDILRGSVLVGAVFLDRLSAVQRAGAWSQLRSGRLRAGRSDGAHPRL